ncbi:coiled-coil domain-containing protein 55-domain containing protein [Melampsora americana]|nr:coiled-coil domain-containing protein 55-domain containing protein [Melampsora americana]
MSAIQFSIGTKTKNSNINSSNKPNHSNKRLTTNKIFDEDEDEEDLTLKIGTSHNSKKPSTSRSGNASLLLPPTNSKLSRQQKLKQEEAAKVDSTVFEYDEVYDDMKSAERQSKLSKDQSGSQRKPQYISGLIETAKQRQIDRVRAEDKMVQRERELEGMEYADKDEFVTPAYLEQQAELRKAEAIEKLKAEQAPSSNGMSLFYKNILDEDAKRNEAAVKAVEAAKRSGGTSLNLTSILSSTSPGTSTSQFTQYDPEPEEVPNEAKLAAEVGKKLGRKVDLDDEGRIIDHRQLLTGGLNVGQPKLGPKKPTKSGFALPIAERARQEREKAEAEAALMKKQEEEEEEGMSQAERLKLSRERQSLLLQQQLIELENKKRRSEEDQMNERIKKVARRNDESKVEELKRQAQERRKARQKILNPTESNSEET